MITVFTLLEWFLYIYTLESWEWYIFMLEWLLYIRITIICSYYTYIRMTLYTMHMNSNFIYYEHEFCILWDMMSMNSNFTMLIGVFIEIWTCTACISEPEAFLGIKRGEIVGRYVTGHVILSCYLKQNLSQHCK